VKDFKGNSRDLIKGITQNFLKETGELTRNISHDGVPAGIRLGNLSDTSHKRFLLVLLPLTDQILWTVPLQN
jgi:hypothetical protein